MGTLIPRTMWWADYAEYLTSSRWQEVRRGALERAGGVCQRAGCSKKATQVHHLTYVRVGGDERPEDLKALCRWCHEKEHGISRKTPQGRQARQKKTPKKPSPLRMARNAARKLERRARKARLVRTGRWFMGDDGVLRPEMVNATG